jgi:hypothetical protein
MTLRAILQKKPQIFDNLGDHWCQMTGGQLLAVDQEGDWVAGGRPFAGLGNGVLPDNWREWLSPEGLQPGSVVVEGQPVQITPLTIQGMCTGYLVAVGQVSPDLFRWSADTLEALVTAEQSLRGMTGELIDAWDQLELVFRVTQTLCCVPSWVRS